MVRLKTYQLEPHGYFIVSGSDFGLEQYCLFLLSNYLHAVAANVA